MVLDILILIVLLLFSALSSAAETAVTSLSALKIRRLVDQGKWGAKSVAFLRENPAKMLSTILITNNSVNVLASVFLTSLILGPLQARFGSFGLAVGIASVAITFILLTFGEIIPKTVAIRNAEPIALFSGPYICVLEVILRPVSHIITFISRPFIYVLGGGKSGDHKPILTEDEIKMILSVGEKEGIIEQEEREMISSIFEISDTVVREVMTPKPDMHCIEVNKPAEEIIKIITEKGYSRVPVFEGGLDNIVGVIYAKDLLRLDRSAPFNIRDYMRQVLFVPETKEVDSLLHEMQSTRTHMAIVVDEYGSTAGLVTLEDLIEEIVGEIHDEFEKGEKSFEKITEKTAMVDGRLTISDLSDLFGVKLPEENVDTVAGFVISQIGKVPAVGDVVRYASVMIRVELVHKRRIVRLRITKEDPKTDAMMGVGG